MGKGINKKFFGPIIGCCNHRSSLGHGQISQVFCRSTNGCVVELSDVNEEFRRHARPQKGDQMIRGEGFRL